MRADFDGYVQRVRASFGFLEQRGYGPPRVCVRGRECTVVYWGEQGVNVAVYHDRGGAPWVQIVALRASRADGTTRTFGLNEAMAILDSDRTATAPPVDGAGFDPAIERAWIEWYAGFLAEFADALLPPSAALLETIEAARAST